MIVREAGVPLPDGAELAATLYLPDGADSAPVPALLEYLPYRKDDAMLARDHDLYAYLARAGYAGARVDIRGTGRSGGTLPGGEYTETEQRDAEAVIAWLAGRPWCTGAVGMQGISWGGFNAIQVALRRPPALKAILAVDASDDLFHDDVHYIDGLPHLDEYALMIDHLNMLPPAPDFPLDEAALARMDTEPWLISFLAQAQDGPFWARASLRPEYGRLTVPAYLIGGWYDGYRDSVPRMLAHVPAPVKVLIGPWNHTYPHNAVPGPAIEWRADAVRWWDHWLKGAENGIMTEPPVTDDLADAVPGHLGAPARAGRDAAGAARDPGGGAGAAGTPVPGAGLSRARPGGAPGRGPALGRDPAGALGRAPRRVGYGLRVLAWQLGYGLPLGTGRGRGVPALRGARRPARAGVRAWRGPDRGPPGRPADGHVVHPGPGRRRDLTALPLPPRAPVGRPGHPRAHLGPPLPPQPLVRRGPSCRGPRPLWPRRASESP